MSNRYVMLYNIEPTRIKDDIAINKIMSCIPEVIISETQVYQNEEFEGQSIWIPEQKYLIAWTIWNYESLLGIEFSSFETDVTPEEGLDWFEKMKRNPKCYKLVGDDGRFVEENRLSEAGTK